MRIKGVFKGAMSMLCDFYKVGRYEWVIAIRKRNEKGMLYDGNLDGFSIIKNPIRYWCADPFLFSHKGKDYIFAELFDRKTKKGVIGVARLKNGKRTRFKVVLDTPYHLSYPFIYEDNNGIHMVPESYQDGQVWIYKCTSFPYKWEKEKKILSGFAADTTRLVYEGEELWFTTEFKNKEERINNNLYVFKSGNEDMKIVKEGYSSRSAGHFILTENARIIRPSQNCTHTYGGNLVFNNVEILGDTYKENAFFEVYAPDDKKSNGAPEIGCNKEKNWIYVGLHTYNSNDRYEVIDLKYGNAVSVYSFVENLKKYIKNKLGIK